MNEKFFSALIFSLIFCGIVYADSTKRECAMENQLGQMKNPFGVLEFLHWNHDWNKHKYPGRASLEKAVGLMQEAGVGWVRVDFLWQDIEPKCGEFSFNKYDEMVDVLTKSGIQVLGILNYATDWASSCGKWNCPPGDNSAFVNYAQKVIGRYKDKVKHWEVWNEPDSAIYWNPQDGLKSYCKLLKEVYLTAKKIDPGCKILNGGFSNPTVSVSKLYENGAKDYFDIMNIHIFESPFNSGAEKRILAYPKFAYKIMKRNNDENKKIWVTEIGCPGLKDGVETKEWWLGKNPTEKQQAEWVKEVYSNLIYAQAVDKVFWAFFRDTNQHWKDGTDYFGLLRWDFSKKPGFDAYKECYKKWQNGGK